jgi:hypothetical protein
VETIKAQGFDPSEFDRDETDDTVLIAHKPTGSVLTIARRSTQNQYSIKWVVGEEKSVRWAAEKPGIVVARWLETLRADIETPDLWEELGVEPEPAVEDGMSGQSEMSSLLRDQINTPFSAAERDQIGRWIEQVRREARAQYELSDRHMRLLEAKLTYIEGALGRTGRLDWLNLTIGALCGALAGDVLTPHIASGILRTLASAIGHLFGQALPQLPA